MIFVTLNGIMKIFHEYLVTRGKNEQIFTTSQSFYHLFWNRIQEITKVFATKLGTLRY